MMKSILMLLLLLSALDAYANDRAPQPDDCSKISSYAAKGDNSYRQKDYQAAIKQYQLQAAWAEICDLDDQKIATAYNNVGLAHAHLGNFGKAFAWFSLDSQDAKSIYNIKQYQQQITAYQKSLSKKTAGTYWRYAGRASWNEIYIQPIGNSNKFSVDFFGLYFPPASTVMSPNMGEFSTEINAVDGKASYVMDPNEQGSCSFDFQFEPNQLTVKRVKGAVFDCGFGMNVVADGTYYQVSN